ncbi:hypothetical protein ACJZ2D_006464 [Fusarium nematophilum]
MMDERLAGVCKDALDGWSLARVWAEPAAGARGPSDGARDNSIVLPQAAKCAGHGVAILNAGNGIINLRLDLFEPRPRSPEDHIRKLVDAECWQWSSAGSAHNEKAQRSEPLDGGQQTMRSQCHAAIAAHHSPSGAEPVPKGQSSVVILRPQPLLGGSICPEGCESEKSEGRCDGRRNLLGQISRKGGPVLALGREARPPRDSRGLAPFAGCRLTGCGAASSSPASQASRPHPSPLACTTEEKS